MSFTARLCFKIAPGDGFRHESNEARLDLANHLEPLVFTSRFVNPPTEQWITAEVAGFESEDAALIEGDRIRHVLLRGLTSLGIGADFGSARPVGHLSSEIRSAYRERLESLSRPAFNEVHGVSAYPTDPKPLFVYCPPVGVRTVTGLQGLVAFLAGERVPTALDPKEHFALELYGASRFESSQRARFVALVTAVEVAADRLKRSDGAQALLDTFLSSLRGAKLPEREQMQLESGIGELRRQSISSACQALVEGNGDAGCAALFKACYQARSQLLHAGSTDFDIAGHLHRLDTVVSGVLVSLTTAGSGPKMFNRID